MFPAALNHIQAGSPTYLLSVAFAFVCIAVQQLVAARYLGPEAFGMWNVFAILLSFGSLAHMGALHGLARELPSGRWREDKEKVRELEAAGFWLNCAGTLVFATCVILLRGELESLAGTAPLHVYLFALLALLQGWTNLVTFRLRAGAQFSDLGRFSMLHQGSILLFVMLLTPYFKMTGLLCGWILSYIAVSVVFYRQLTEVHAQPLRYVAVSRLFRIGLPIMVFTLTLAINWSLDRILILTFLDVRIVGIFSVASFALRVLLYVPEVWGQLLYPQWAKWEKQHGQEMPKYAAQSLSQLPWMLAAICGLVYYGCALIPLILPRYTDSVLPAQLLSLGAPLYGMGIFSGYMLGALRREKLVLGIQIVVSVARCLLVGVVLFKGGSVLEVALCSALVGMLLGGILFYALVRELRAKRIIVASAVGICMLTAGIVAAVEWARGLLGWSGESNTSIVAAAGVFLMVLMGIMKLTRAIPAGKQPPLRFSRE